MQTMATTKRESDTGRYAHSDDAPCRCGHQLGSHTAGAARGKRPCLAGELLEGVSCECGCFKPAAKTP